MAEDDILGNESHPPLDSETTSSSPGQNGSSPSVKSSTQLHPLVHQSLSFLSTADSSTLTAFLGGLGLVAYLLFGGVGLLLVGVIIGVVLHATWEGFDAVGSDDGDYDRVSRRREKGLDIINRLINWQERKNARPDISAHVSGDVLSDQPDYSSFTPETEAALNALTDAVIRDYVRAWYEPLVPSQATFPLSCRAALARFILSISSHVSRKRPADVFLHFLTNAASIVIVFMNELSAALTSPNPSLSPSSSAVDAVSSYLENHPKSHLANVLSSEEQQTKLRMVAGDILHNFLESDLYKCEPMRLMLLNTFSEVVLESVIRSCSAPEWINGWIVYFLEEGEPELMNAIDAGVDRGSRAVPEESDLRTVTSDDSRLPRTVSMDKASDMASAQERAKDTDVIRRLTPTSDDELRQTSALQSASSISTPQTPLTPSTDELRRPASAEGMVHSISQESAVRPSLDMNQPPVTLSQPILHNAAVSILDDFIGDNTKLRVKPINTYLLQIEPVSRNPGWIITRKYSDFETLHEVLRRISVVSGVSGFTERHKELPSWKGSTMQDLRQNLELYLKDALRCEPLAESEAMRRFLEKSRDSMAGLKTDTGKSGFSFGRQNMFENMGKGVLGALSNAPKGVTGGGKAVFDGVAGVFGNSIAGRRSLEQVPTRSRLSKSSETLNMSNDTLPLSPTAIREKLLDSPGKVARSDETNKEMEDTATPVPLSVHDEPRLSRSSTGSVPDYTPVQSESAEGSISSVSSSFGSQRGTPSNDTVVSADGLSTAIGPSEQPLETENSARLSGNNGTESTRAAEKPTAKRPQEEPLSEEETRVAVELLFAVLTEMYSLSSVWNIRKKLLNASKSFLLRPGNPHIESIRCLLQDSVVDIFSLDENRAYHITKLRENAVPSKEEYEAWPAPLSDEEKENLRVRARKLLTTRGMPLALMSVMGSSATEEALGRIFDCLQIERVARGIVFAVFLQLLKAVLQ